MISESEIQTVLNFYPPSPIESLENQEIQECGFIIQREITSLLVCMGSLPSGMDGIRPSKVKVVDINPPPTIPSSILTNSLARIGQALIYLLQGPSF